MTLFEAQNTATADNLRTKEWTARHSTLRVGMGVGMGVGKLLRSISTVVGDHTTVLVEIYFDPKAMCSS